MPGSDLAAAALVLSSNVHLIASLLSGFEATTVLMEKHDSSLDPECRIDHKIDLLLRQGDDDSIVDSFFAVSRELDNVLASDQWEQVMFSSMQRRLAERMRALIDAPRTEPQGRLRGDRAA